MKPYWGKLAVRNFRGDDGNVGIIRSPVRAIVLPDPAASLGIVLPSCHEWWCGLAELGDLIEPQD